MFRVSGELRLKAKEITCSLKALAAPAISVYLCGWVGGEGVEMRLGCWGRGIGDEWLQTKPLELIKWRHKRSGSQPAGPLSPSSRGRRCHTVDHGWFPQSTSKPHCFDKPLSWINLSPRYPYYAVDVDGKYKEKTTTTCAVKRIRHRITVWSVSAVGCFYNYC